MAIDPLVGAINPASIRSVVVLPAPFGPSSATISDRPTSKLTSLTAVRGPNRRVRCDAEITAAGSAEGARGARDAGRTGLAGSPPVLPLLPFSPLQPLPA